MENTPFPHKKSFFCAGREILRVQFLSDAPSLCECGDASGKKCPNGCRNTRFSPCQAPQTPRDVQIARVLATLYAFAQNTLQRDAKNAFLQELRKSRGAQLAPLLCQIRTSAKKRALLQTVTVDLRLFRGERILFAARQQSTYDRGGRVLLRVRTRQMPPIERKNI